MNHPHAIGKPQTQVGVFPGVAPVKTEVTSKLGSIQPAKPSAPRRLLDKILVGLHLRSNPQAVQLAPAPLPLKAAVVPKLANHVVAYANQLALVGPDHHNAGPIKQSLADAVNVMLGQLRSGALTAELPPEAISALVNKDVAALSTSLKQLILASTPPSAQARVTQSLDAELQGIVQANIQAAQAPLTASAPGALFTDKPLLLQEKNGHPIVRLQALGVSQAAMAPMLKTLEKIGDALFNGQTDRADDLLMGFIDQLRPLLEAQPKAVQLAFAKSDGQSFIADLHDAVLGQVHGDVEKRQVSAWLDDFKQTSLKDGFLRLVNNLPGAQNVKAVLPSMPASANVAVLALQRLGSAAQAVVEAQAKDALLPEPGRVDEALRQLGAATTDLLRLVREDAATLALDPAMKQALASGDMGAFVSALRSHVLAAVPADQRNAAAWAFDRAVVPASQADETAHGPLKAVPVPGPTLVPKTTFDSHLLPAARLDMLASTPKQRQEIEAALARVAQAMAHGDPAVIRGQLDRLNLLLKPLLAQQSDSLKLAFTLSNGEAFMGDLAHAILSQAPEAQSELVANQLNLFMRPYLQAAFDQLVTQVLDHDTGEPDLPPEQITHNGGTYQRMSPSPDSRDAVSTHWQYVNTADPHDVVNVSEPLRPPVSIVVQGRTYVRDDRSALGSGNFGEVWAYSNPDDPEDRVVMKTPKLGGLDPHSAEARKVMVDDPLREGLASLVAMGTGGGDTNNAKLLGAIRGTDSVNLVYRLEKSGSLLDKVSELNSADTSPAMARGKLGLLQDLVGALRRLHESKGVVHLDIALRNVLVDAKGRAVLADYGMSQLLPDGGSIEGANARPATNVLPIVWTAPEVLKGQPATEKSEVFSLGVAFIELAFGLDGNTPPWSSAYPQLLAQTIGSMRITDQWDAATMVQKLGDLSSNAWPDPTMRQDLMALITQMLDNSPDQRPSLADVAKSPLFNGISEDDRKALLAVLSPPPAPEQEFASNYGYAYVPALEQAQPPTYL